jgi:hypothetical protein
MLRIDVALRHQGYIQETQNLSNSEQSTQASYNFSNVVHQISMCATFIHRAQRNSWPKFECEKNKL